jgi:hypothetical protein
LTLPAYRWRFAHLAALWGYGVSQPVFSLLKGNPEFLVFTGVSRTDTVAFALILAFGPALLVVLLEIALGAASYRAGSIVHLLVLWSFGFLALLQVLAAFDPTSAWTMVLPAAAAYGGTIAYARWSAVRSFLSLSLALPILGLLGFVSTAPLAVPDAEAAHASVPGRTPVVLVVFDELPLSSLMTRSGSIDAQRYPNFGRLARGGTWYSRATTVADGTTHAVPAILSGDVPERGDLPTLADYPHNLFTLLGDEYAVRAREPVTRLCPVRYCPEHRIDPSRTSRLRRLFHDVAVDYFYGAVPADVFDESAQVAEGWPIFVENTNVQGVDFFRALEPTDRPRTLYFLHVLQPHQPWTLLPSGRRYNDPWLVAGVTEGRKLGEDKHWRQNDLLVEQGLQHHLLQVRAVDRLVGAMLYRLERAALLDRALVVITADHGASFRADGWIRRATPTNLSDIAVVPLFVKYPHQERGREDRRAAETIDILPTIADVLDVDVPWRVEGRSLRAAPVDRNVRVGRFERPAIVARPDVVASGLLATARRNVAWLGQGADSLYRIGPRQDLLSRPVAKLRAFLADDARVGIPRLSDLEHVRKASGYLPVHFLARISWDSLRPAEDVAVAVNGRVAAVTRPFPMRGETWVDAMIDEKLLRDGQNHIGVYAVRGRGGATRLIFLGGNEAAPRHIAASSSD